MDCTTFRSRAIAFLGDALEPAERSAFREHLDACAACARRLEIEASFERGLRRRLAVPGAPPGLESRVRAALREAADRGRRPVPWWTRAWVPATFAAVALVAVLFAGPSPRPVAVPGEVTLRGLVVDHDCDVHGIAPRAQRDCLDPTHANVLRLADGRYVRFANGARDVADGVREALAARGARGVEVAVAGRYVPATRTLEVASVAGL